MKLEEIEKLLVRIENGGASIEEQYKLLDEHRKLLAVAKTAKLIQASCNDPHILSAMGDTINQLDKALEELEREE